MIIIQILSAFFLMASGFLLIALVYRFRNIDWNGYGDKTKMSVAAGIMAIVAILLIAVPDTATLIRDCLAITVDLEHTKKGFVTFGALLSFALNMAYKPKNNTQNGSN